MSLRQSGAMPEGTKDDLWQLSTAPKLRPTPCGGTNPLNQPRGLRRGYRGRFGMYLPPLLEALGKVELTHEAHNNKVRAIV
jgi:hypothetical protein